MVVPLNAEDTEVPPAGEAFTAHASDCPNIWYVYPDEQINITSETWETQLIISLRTNDMRKYSLTLSLTCYGCDNVVSYGRSVAEGTIAEITRAVDSDRFTDNACSVFNACREVIALKIEESRQHYREMKLFENTDIADYHSLMKFVDVPKEKNVLKSIGYGMELFTYKRVVALIDRSSKSVNILVDRDGIAQFCRLADFPAGLLDMIRREREGWNLGVHELSVGKFNENGQAFLTWIISPYYYCPMDEDGFGEEEEYEVAVTCHINTKGHLVDTPVWKPYTGPRR